MAKCDARWWSLAYAAASTGANWTPAMISSAARSTVNRPWKKSRAFTTRQPFGPFDVDLGVERQHHRRVVGRRIGVREAAAERAAIADLRIADLGRAPRRRTGHACRSSADVATSWCTVPAPISILPSFSRMPERPGMRAMSISVCGSLSRSFISGTRLWPPAMNLPSPLAAASFASASSSDVARAVFECGRDHALASG